MTIQQDIAAHVEYTLARTRQVRAAAGIKACAGVLWRVRSGQHVDVAAAAQVPRQGCVEMASGDRPRPLANPSPARRTLPTTSATRLCLTACATASSSSGTTPRPTSSEAAGVACGDAAVGQMASWAKNSSGDCGAAGAGFAMAALEDLRCRVCSWAEAQHQRPDDISRLCSALQPAGAAGAVPLLLLPCAGVAVWRLQQQRGDAAAAAMSLAPLQLQGVTAAPQQPVVQLCSSCRRSARSLFSALSGAAIPRARREQDPKRVYYLSMEFLMGRSLMNCLYNLGIKEDYDEALREIGCAFRARDLGGCAGACAE